MTLWLLIRGIVEAIGWVTVTVSLLGLWRIGSTPDREKTEARADSRFWNAEQAAKNLAAARGVWRAP